MNIHNVDNLLSCSLMAQVLKTKNTNKLKQATCPVDYSLLFNLNLLEGGKKKNADYNKGSQISELRTTALITDPQRDKLRLG